VCVFMNLACNCMPLKHSEFDFENCRKCSNVRCGVE